MEKGTEKTEKGTEKTEKGIIRFAVMATALDGQTAYCRWRNDVVEKTAALQLYHAFRDHDEAEDLRALIVRYTAGIDAKAYGGGDSGGIYLSVVRVDVADLLRAELVRLRVSMRHLQHELGSDDSSAMVVPTVRTLPEAVVAHIRAIAAKTARFDDDEHVPADSSGGNYDDCYQNGLDDGEVSLARDLVAMLNLVAADAPPIIEVCARMTRGLYHACVQGNTKQWSQDTSPEKAVRRLCRYFNLPTTNLSVRYLIDTVR